MKIIEKEIKENIAEYIRLPVASVDQELSMIRSALFVEQTFGIPLVDDDISEANFGTPDALERFVSTRLELL